MPLYNISQANIEDEPNETVIYCTVGASQHKGFITWISWSHTLAYWLSHSNSVSIPIPLSSDPCRALAWLSGQQPTKLRNIITNNNVGSWSTGEREREREKRKVKNILYCREKGSLRNKSCQKHNHFNITQMSLTGSSLEGMSRYSC